MSESRQKTLADSTRRAQAKEFVSRESADEPSTEAQPNEGMWKKAGDWVRETNQGFKLLATEKVQSLIPCEPGSRGCGFVNSVSDVAGRGTEFAAEQAEWWTVGKVASAVITVTGTVAVARLGTVAEAGGGLGARARGEMIPAAEELLRQAVGRPPELMNGFRIFGNKGLVGSTFQRNVLLIEAEAKGTIPIRQLVGAMETEARAAGASRLSITGHAIVNEGFLNPAIARRYGFQFRMINDSTVELVKELTP